MSTSPDALLEAEELVAVLVDLGADVAAGRQRHQHELQMPARVEDAAEILIPVVSRSISS